MITLATTWNDPLNHIGINPDGVLQVDQWNDPREFVSEYLVTYADGRKQMIRCDPFYPDPVVKKPKRLRCEYCGRIATTDRPTCEGCGAVLPWEMPYEA